MEVKPWDDETDMKELEKCVRSIEMDGLVWGGGKLVPVGYGVSKLQINLVIEDDKVGLDDLQDAIAEFEDYVQSSDVSRNHLNLRKVLTCTDRCYAKAIEWIMHDKRCPGESFIENILHPTSSSSRLTCLGELGS